VAGGRATALSLCVQAVGYGLTGLAVQFSDESALEVRNTWYALYKSTFLPYLTFKSLKVILFIVSCYQYHPCYCNPLVL